MDNVWIKRRRAKRGAKLKVLSINTSNFGSTGNIMLQLQECCKSNGMKMLVAFPKSRSNMKKRVANSIYIGSILSRNIHLQLSNLTGYNGTFSYFSTLNFLRKVKKYNPDIIHLHNLHNGYINLPLLFTYIKKNNIPTVWTLHDCWSFTGQCPHFTLAKCDKWKNGCYDCTQYREYPESLVDRTKTMWKLKKKWFTGVKNMTIVTPSQWLADLVKESFLGKYPIKVINNGIDLNVFKPAKNNFKEKYGIENKHIVLGVSFGWGYRKGLDVFIELSKQLGESYQLVLVGTDVSVDKQLPKNIISIHRTQDQKELAELYTAADVFVNPTREENYPTVNMEALACGTPIVTFKTGGSPEILDNTCGVVVDCEDTSSMKKAIIDICENGIFTEDACLRRSRSFKARVLFDEYIDLYNTIGLKHVD